MCTWGLEKKPGSNSQRTGAQLTSMTGAGRRGVVVGGVVPDDDEDSAVHLDDVDVVAVEPAQDVAADHLLGGAGGRPAAGQVDDAGP